MRALLIGAVMSVAAVLPAAAQNAISADVLKELAPTGKLRAAINFGNGVLALLRHPAQMTQLRADSSAQTVATAPAARIPAASRSPRLSPNRADGPVPLRCRGTGYAYSVKILRAEQVSMIIVARRQGGAGAEGG